jgi:hypothetical protein
MTNGIKYTYLFLGTVLSMAGLLFSLASSKNYEIIFLIVYLCGFSSLYMLYLYYKMEKNIIIILPQFFIVIYCYIDVTLRIFFKIRFF